MEMVEVEKLFHEARLQLERQLAGETVQPVSSRVLAEPSEEDIRAVARRWFHGYQRKTEADDLAARYPTKGEPEADLREMRIALDDQEAYLRNPVESDRDTDRLARQELEKHGFRMPAGEMRVLTIGLFRRGQLESVLRSRGSWHPASVHTPDDDFRDINATSLQPAAPPRGGLSVAKLFETYIAAPERKGKAGKTAIKYAGFARVLGDLLGPTTLAERVTREQCREVQKDLMRFPVNAAQRYRSLAAPDAIVRAARDGAKTLHHQSVGNYLDFLSAAFRWGQRERRLKLPDGNPAEALSVTTTRGVSGAAAKSRAPFAIGDLRAIFGAPLYTGCLDDTAGYAIPGPNRPQRGRFWVPLICLFAGLRLNEACQLGTADVIEVDGIHLFDINVVGGWKQLKTKAAQRRVPVHPELLRIGILG